MNIGEVFDRQQVEMKGQNTGEYWKGTKGDELLSMQSRYAGKDG